MQGVGIVIKWQLHSGGLHFRAICLWVLESSLNALFPVYALRKGFDVDMILIILSVFTFGGAVIFGIASFVEHSQIAVAVAFFFTGTLVGSMFSLGITYMADLTPKELLPTGNLLCGIALSIGSLTGPF